MSTPTPDNKKTEAKAKKVLIVAVHGEMIHQFTNERFSSDPKPAEMDNFIEVQIAAGKLAIYTE